MNKRSGMQWQPWVVLAATAVLGVGCGNPPEGGWEQGPATVEVVAVQPRALVLSSELPGRIEPVRVAEVRARVAGIVLKRNFTEGADVKAGQVLFQIDPAPFRTALARAEATLFEARATLQRYEPLVKIKAISQQDFDTAQAAYKTAAADVEAARLDLSYATVTAPISGRIGRALVTEGALVGQGEVTPLATIQQLDPVYADFKQPVADALRLRATKKDGGEGAPISVTLEGTGETREGRLLFSDITVDRGTGQVSLRGEVPNPDGLLLPGLYVRVNIGEGTDANAILVPQRAVQRSTDGKAQVLVVGKDDVAEARPVRTGAMHGSEWRIVEGLNTGERVIVGSTGGAVQPGAKVVVADPAAAQNGKPEDAAAPAAQ